MPAVRSVIPYISCLLNLYYKKRVSTNVSEQRVRQRLEHNSRNVDT